MSTKRAVPVHTIIRYQANAPAFYQSWQPVTIHRWRLFVGATHEEVTGDVGHGAPWDHDWSCEHLSQGSSEPYWRITGRNEWPTPKAALAAVSVDTHATYQAALAEARARATILLEARRRQVAEAEWAIERISNLGRVPPPILPE